MAQLVYEEMSFKGFSVLSSGGHFVQRSETILAILVEGSPKEHFCGIFWKSGHWSRRRCHLKVFIFLALAAILLRVTEPVSQFW